MADDGWKNLFDAFARVAAENAVRRAVVADDATLTYADLAVRVDALCRSLSAADLACGDRVAVVLPNGAEFIVAVLAIWKMGAVAVPVHVKSRADELARTLAECDVTVVLSDVGLTPLVDALQRDSSRRAAAILYSSAEAAWSGPVRGSSPDRVEIRDGYRQADSESAALMQYSTGSTGRSKRIARSHRQLVDEFRTVSALLGLTREDRILAAVPLCHSYGFMNAMIHGVLSGAALFPVADFFVREVVRLIERERITAFPGVPFMFQQLAAFTGTADLSSIRCARSTGAPLAEETARSVRERYGVAVHQQYGSTETGMISIDLDAGVGAVSATVGRAIPGVTIAIVDENRTPLPPGAEGAVAVRSAYAASGYEGDPGEGDSYFEAGVFYPGDRGALDDTGRLELRGRSRRFINVAGTKVDPAEVERLLQTHPAVSEAAVVGMPDGARGERVKAIVVVTHPVAEREIFEFCRSRAADVKCPRVIEFRERLPRDAMGKVVRKGLLDG